MFAIVICLVLLMCTFFVLCVLMVAGRAGLRPLQRMRTQWASHFQRHRAYHDYRHYSYSYPDWATRNPFSIVAP